MDHGVVQDAAVRAGCEIKDIQDEEDGALFVILAGGTMKHLTDEFDLLSLRYEVVDRYHVIVWEADDNGY